MLKKIIFVLLISITGKAIAQCNSCSSIIINGTKILSVGANGTYSATISGCNGTSSASLLRWDYGDGTAITTNTTHSFASSGIYTIKCFLNNPGNCPVVATTMKVVVNGCKSNACSNFDFYYPNELCTKEKISFVKFLDDCKPVLLSSDVRWDYGDGSAITTDSFHVFSNAGSYLVTMIGPKCVVAKIIYVTECPTLLNCNPSNVSCQQLNLNAATTTISFVNNPGSNQYKYTVTPNVGNPNNDFNYSWSIAPGSASGVSIVASTQQSREVIFNKPPASEGDVILQVQICSKSIAGCCITKTFNPCSDFNPEIQFSSEVHNDVPVNSASTCSFTAAVKQPIVGSVQGTNYNYSWSGTSGAVFGSPAAQSTNVVIPQRYFAKIDVLVVEQNNKGCKKMVSTTIHNN